MAKSCIISVQKCTVCLNNKELRACAVRITGSCHGNSSSCVGNIIVHSIVTELTLNILFRSTCSVSVGITTLNHESFHDTMECQSVIETFLCEFHEICHCDRCCICIQFHINRTVILYFNLCVMNSCQFFGSIQKHTGCTAV